MTFEELQLNAPLLKALAKLGYLNPTPIQEKAIPPVLAGKDLLACAQTGTGKTAAFALPLIQRITESKTAPIKGRNPKALILTPTRELALQIHENVIGYAQNLPFKSAVIFGGVSQHKQATEIRAGVDLLVATPGRLLDLLNQQLVRLTEIRFLVLDEADRMLDMGFVKDVQRIIAKLPFVRQTLFFSATMPSEIRLLAESILRNPVSVAVNTVSSTATTVAQRVYYVFAPDKKALLVKLLQAKNIDSALVFTRTKHGADRLVKDLARENIVCRAIHGNKSQAARQSALKDFKDKALQALVATDIAARGIDVELLSHVINFEIPHIAETYVHRIGRTGRAGANGIALSFCSPEEVVDMKAIEKLIGQPVEVSATSEFKSFDPKTVFIPKPASAAPKGRPAARNHKRKI